MVVTMALAKGRVKRIQFEGLGKQICRNTINEICDIHEYLNRRKQILGNSTAKGSAFHPLMTVID